jgi:hypothetical protein
VQPFEIPPIPLKHDRAGPLFLDIISLDFSSGIHPAIDWNTRTCVADL